MIPRPGLCIENDGSPSKVHWRHSRVKISPPFFISPDPFGHLSLAYIQGHFFSLCLDFYHGRWITTEQYIHAARRDEIERQKTKPWTYRTDKWDEVKVVVLPRTDPDSLVVDSNTAVVVEKKKREIGGVPAVPGAILIRGQKMDCDYEALARIVGHDVARGLFKKHNREISATG